MIGTNLRQDQGLPVKDPQGAFGAGTQYDLAVQQPFRYNGTLANSPVLSASNKPSEHNILNAQLTPLMVVAQLAPQKRSRQTGKLTSLPIKIPGLSF